MGVADPEAAKKLGVTPGPLFKKLREGFKVNVNGKIIYPEDVLRQEKRIINIRDETAIKIVKEKLFK